MIKIIPLFCFLFGSLYASAISDVCLIGDATSAGWDIGNEDPLTSSNIILYVYVCEEPLSAG